MKRKEKVGKRYMWNSELYILYLSEKCGLSRTLSYFVSTEKRNDL